jgi:hypothetical protein
VGKLIQLGFKLAVLGVDPQAPHGWWHILRPGSFNTPCLGENLTYGRSVCGMNVISNGYASDFTPPDGSFCPACREQI